MNVLGLRNLASPGLLPVKKAYIEFGLENLIPPHSKSALTNIRTIPGPTGADPTINTILDFKLRLPRESRYAPSLSCRVFDKIFTGFDGQMIGSFSIPIGQIMDDQRKFKFTILKQMELLIMDLKRILVDAQPVEYSPQLG